MKTIDHDLLSADIGKINFNLDDNDNDNYNIIFTSLLDKRALLKTDYVEPRDVQPLMTEEIMSARREKRKGERVGRKSRLEVHLQMFIALCLILKNLIHGEKGTVFQQNRFQTVVGIKGNCLALLTLCWGAERRHDESWH